jgi:hypothetical protein
MHPPAAVQLLCARRRVPYTLAEQAPAAQGGAPGKERAARGGAPAVVEGVLALAGRECRVQPVRNLALHGPAGRTRVGTLSPTM